MKKMFKVLGLAVAALWFQSYPLLTWAQAQEDDFYWFIKNSRWTAYLSKEHFSSVGGCYASAVADWHKAWPGHQDAIFTIVEDRPNVVSWKITNNASGGLTCERVVFNKISLMGGGQVKALPAGRPMELTARVTALGEPVAGISVSIHMVSQDGELGDIGGVTDDFGEFSFLYVPPYFTATSVSLEARCSDCNNVASGAITVVACDIGQCEPAKGNPIQPGSAEKLENETDWADASAHPLSVTRHYRSFGNVDAGMGGGWAHSYAARLEGQPGAQTRMVRLGDGTKSIFSAPEAGEWVGARGDLLSEDPAGQWIFTRLSDGTRWNFDADGRLLNLAQTNGWTYELKYNDLGLLASVTNAFGRSLQFDYTDDGNLHRIRLPADQGSIIYRYDVNRLSTVTATDGSTIGYVYENDKFPFALTGRLDGEGQRVGSYSYDSRGRAVSTSQAGGAGGYSIDYGSSHVGSQGSLASDRTNDPNWRKATVTIRNPQGGTEILKYEGGDGQVRVAGVSGTSQGYAAAERSFAPGTTLPTLQTDFEGVQTEITWDIAQGLPIQRTRAVNRAEWQTTRTEWSPILRLPLKIVETGAQGGHRVTEYVYDERGLLLKEVVTDLSIEPARSWNRSWRYTEQNLLFQEVDEAGKVTTHTYDTQGNRTSTTDPLSRTTAYTYDGAGRVLTVTDPSGVVTNYSYDQRGRLLTQTIGGLTTTMTYLPIGLLSSLKQPSGYQIEFQYDAASRLVAWLDNRGNSERYFLDAMGNRLSERVTDAQGDIVLDISRTMNAENRVASETMGGIQATTYDYDANGSLTRITNGLNETRVFRLDGLRRQIAELNPLSDQAEFSYNSLNGVTQATDFKGVRTDYSRDTRGNPRAEVSADIGSQIHQYDARGVLVMSEDAQGRRIAMSRDALGRLIEIQSAEGGVNLNSKFIYDGHGELGELQDAGINTRFQRDTIGRQIRKVQHIGEAGP